MSITLRIRSRLEGDEDEKQWGHIKKGRPFPRITGAWFNIQWPQVSLAVRVQVKWLLS